MMVGYCSSCYLFLIWRIKLVNPINQNPTGNVQPTNVTRHHTKYNFFTKLEDSKVSKTLTNPTTTKGNTTNNVKSVCLLVEWMDKYGN